jgi:Ca2+/H+ antiporter, TMEM165/GDT1 family
MDTVLVAFAVVFVAELGDKTQLVALSLATRYRLPIVLAGMAIAYAATQGIAALVGAVPTDAISVGAGILFLAFAVWTLLDDEDEDADTAGRGSLLGVIGTMVVAELGDKSMLAGATLAADRSPFPVWIGATLGETAAGAIAVVVGGVLGARLPERGTRLLAAALFAVFGVILLVDAL